MKRLYNILLVCACTMALVSCMNDAKVKESGDNTPSAEKGVLSLNIGTRNSDGNTPSYTISIYQIADSKSTLVRKYTKEDKPEYIWLLAGDYSAHVVCGEPVPATFNSEERYYVGSSLFEIVGGETTNVDIVAVGQNVPVKVNFDQTITEGFLDGYHVEVWANDEVKLRYTESAEGYFIMPQNTTSLSWRFVGTFVYEDNGEQVEVDRSGSIENIELKKAYSLSFKFSKDASGLLDGLTATVDERIEERDDHLAFSPDPELKGVGFDLAAPYNYTGGERQYLATAPSIFNNVVITVGDRVFEPVSNTVPGIMLTGLNSAQLYITLSDDFFNSLSGGSQIINMRVFDVDGGSVAKDLPYNLQGVKALDYSSIDLWSGITPISATVFGAPASVEIVCREGEGEWQSFSATSSENNTYIAQVNGIEAGRTYECNLVINGKTIGTSIAFTTEKGAQIPNGDMESWCVSDKVTYPGPSKNSKYWDSGNEGTSMVGETLTSSSTDIRPGSKGQYSALLDSKTIDAVIMKQFGAGNIFVGDFGEASLSPIGATVYFGQPFTYNAKPKGVKMWVKYNCGTIDNKGSAGVNKGEPDLTKIFCCICNWKSAWCVDSTKANETTFSPSMNDIKNCTDGRYDGVLYTAYFESRTSNTEWHELYIPFEKIEGTDDSSGANYLVLTATCSGYGDYFTGSSDSWMYIDDIELVY